MIFSANWRLTPRTRLGRLEHAPAGVRKTLRYYENRSCCCIYFFKCFIFYCCFFQVFRRVKRLSWDDFTSSSRHRVVDRVTHSDSVERSRKRLLQLATHTPTYAWWRTNFKHSPSPFSYEMPDHVRRWIRRERNVNSDDFLCNCVNSLYTCTYCIFYDCTFYLL